MLFPTIDSSEVTMKTVRSILSLTALFILFVCGEENKRSANDIITVDVNANYPRKEIALQDFMDIEYIALETTDEFITQGFVKAIGKDILLISNRNDGDIFVFDRMTGKGLRKINCLGQGRGEYTQFTEIILDEDNEELFVADYHAQNILVYDLYGNFKRDFKCADNSYYDYTFNYDRNHLICHKSYMPEIETEQSSHALISKRDGSIARNIQLPYHEIRTPVITDQGGIIAPGFCLTVPNRNDWVIMRTSSDTVYNYSADGQLNPLLVRKPSIQSMEIGVFLFPTVITDQYIFMRTIKKEVDFTLFQGFFGTELVYDKQDNTLYECVVYNDDFLNKEQIVLRQTSRRAVNQEIATSLSFSASALVEAYKKGELKGQLNEIAQELNEESNPVVMLAKRKK